MLLEAPTKIKAGASVFLEEGPVGFGLDVGSFLHQQLDVAEASPLDGHVQRRLTCSQKTRKHRDLCAEENLWCYHGKNSLISQFLQ